MPPQTSLPATSDADGSRGRQPADQRVDIQWMRALAVGLVLLYHLWPKRLPGGFVGVDVFLVISGFLITSHLLLNPPQRPRDLAAFWGRRIRRLLPASFLVIVVTSLGVLLFAPETVWHANALSAIASSLYVGNWNLALTSVDYLASTNAAPALQHYWSLSVEEQFYLVWPILVAIVWLATRKWPARFRLVAGVGMLTCVLASLLWSGYYTLIEPAPAYFVTTTRMWELGLGGALAAVYPVAKRLLKPRRTLRLALVAAGGLAMLVAALLFTGDSFPGVIALVPVLGACSIIVAGPATDRVSFDTILGLPPFRLLGDISYSVYLWHWPLIVVTTWVVGQALQWPVKLGVIVVTLGLAWATKVLIEDRFRGTHPLGVPLRRTYIFLLVGMLVASGSGAGLLVAQRVVEGPPRPPVIPPTATCVGAAIRLDPTCQGQDPHGRRPLMTPYQAPYDKGIAWRDSCFWNPNYPDVYPLCQYGAKDTSAPTMALFGNSHAGPYVTPLASLAEQHGWSLRTYIASFCYPATLPESFTNPDAVRGCLEFTTRAIQDMRRQNVKLVVMAAMTQGNPLVGPTLDNQQQAFRDMFSAIIDEFTASGIAVVVIRDLPYPAGYVLDCLAANRHNETVCDTPRTDAILPDPLFEAAAASSNTLVSALDFTDAFCDATTCWAVVGGVVVYFDNAGHMTNTFSKTLQPYLESALVPVMASSR